MNSPVTSATSASFEPLVAGDEFTNPVVAAQPAGSASPALDDTRDFFVSSVEGEKKKAYDRGVADGERNTLTSMSEKLDAQMARWRDTIVSLDAGIADALDVFFKKMEARVVAVGLDAARKILAAEIRTQPDVVATRIRDALSRYRAEPAISVHVNPADFVFLDRLRGEAADDTVRMIHYESSPDVPRGGFVVETARARFDHTVESELKKMEQILADLYEPSEDQ